MKKAWYNAYGLEIQQYIIDTPEAIDALMSLSPQMKRLGYGDKFRDYLDKGQVIICNTTTNNWGGFAWRTEEVDNWNRLRMVA